MLYNERLLELRQKVEEQRKEIETLKESKLSIERIWQIIVTNHLLDDHTLSHPDDTRWNGLYQIIHYEEMDHEKAKIIFAELQQKHPFGEVEMFSRKVFMFGNAFTLDKQEIVLVPFQKENLSTFRGIHNRSSQHPPSVPTFKILK